MAKRVIIGIGADKPGVEKFSMDCSTEDPKSLANALRPHWQACSEAVENSENDEAFVWVTVTDDNGDWDFDLEDQLTELLDD